MITLNWYLAVAVETVPDTRQLRVPPAEPTVQRLIMVQALLLDVREQNFMTH